MIEAFGALEINQEGQLGIFYPRKIFIPTKTSLENILQISSGHGEHLLMLNSQNTIFVTGRNDKGQLGFKESHSIFKTIEIKPKYCNMWGYQVNRAKSARK